MADLTTAANIKNYCRYMQSKKGIYKIGKHIVVCPNQMEAALDSLQNALTDQNSPNSLALIYCSLTKDLITLSSTRLEGFGNLLFVFFTNSDYGFVEKWALDITVSSMMHSLLYVFGPSIWLYMHQAVHPQPHCYSPPPLEQGAE
ncbi:hypothetical protein [Spongorhabdus nitratireducens]